MIIKNNVVSGGAPVLTINDFTGQLGGAQRNLLGTVTGTVTLSGYTVWVNGSNAAISGTNWTATNVCVGPGGTAVMDAQAIPNSDDGGAGSGSTGTGDGTPVNHTAADAVATELQIDQPPFLYVSEHHQSETDSEVVYLPAYDATETSVNTYSEDAAYFGGGTVTSTGTVSWTNGSPNGTNVATESWSSDLGPASITLTIEGFEDSPGTIWPWDNPLGADYEQPSWIQDTGSLLEESGYDDAGSIRYGLGSIATPLAEMAWWGQQSGADPAISGTFATSFNEWITSETILQTGGKAVPYYGRKLYGIMVSATNYSIEYGLPDDGPNMGFATNQISPSLLSVMGQTPGSDGMMYPVLENNQTYSVTVLAAAQNYTYAINATNIPMTLTANGVDLSTNTPTFCVGQQVTFVLKVTAPYTDALGTFTLPPTFVNTNWPANSSTNSSTDWGTNYNLLSFNTNGSPTTTCWYLDGPGGKVSVGASLELTNGTTVGVGALGNIIIYKPVITGFTNYYPGAAMYLTNGVLSLGNPVSGTNEIYYGIFITSQFAGAADFCQLINRSANAGLTLDNTSGQYWLDMSMPYMKAIGSTIPAFTNTEINLSDSPNITLDHSVYDESTSISDSMIDFVIFKPTGSTNIWVTLGTNSWSWSASSTYSSGTWSAPSGGVTVPSSPSNSSQLPQWPNTHK